MVDKTASAQQYVCAMVAGHQGMKFSFYITFAHVDRTRLRKPPRLMHSRCGQGGGTDKLTSDNFRRWRNWFTD